MNSLTFIFKTRTTKSYLLHGYYPGSKCKASAISLHFVL
uniref:Uncharacterized protein n=1 Tax=Arundo donax TaxID=35708 RepID=A0A0A9AR09_ARUDO